MMLRRASRGLASSRLSASRFLAPASRSLSTDVETVKELEALLAKAKARLSDDAGGAAASAETASGERFTIGTFNAISEKGLAKFPKRSYEMAKMDGGDPIEGDVHAVLLRSYKLKSDEVPNSVRAIARCGAGTNNIPVSEMSERGIPVFNTPGANANAVKELVLCALLLCSRGIVDGIQHTKKIYEDEGLDNFDSIKKRVEAEKKFFVGQELAGKTLGVVGLGHIGASVAATGLNLGMNVVGYDPVLNVDSAWKLPGDKMTRMEDLNEMLAECDYVSLNVPYNKNTHHLIGETQLKAMKPNAHLVNFARAELVDSEFMKSQYASGERSGRYICDFPDEHLYDNPRVTLIPHLGASTNEAEESAAAMAAEEIVEFIETGNVRNSVNFPECQLPLPPSDVSGSRLCIVNQNVPGVLGLITSTVGSAGFNIAQQLNASRGDVAYNVVDLAESVGDSDIDKLQEEVSKLDGVLSQRVIDRKSLKPGFFRVSA